MNCPSCFSVMRCESEIHKVGNDGQRMDLCCWNDNDKCPARGIMYVPAMIVIAYPNQRWICNKYYLPFNHKGKWYAMEGASHGKTSIKSINTSSDMFKNLGYSLITSIPFQPISTDNDMHLEATKLFNRLIGLVIFS